MIGPLGVREFISLTPQDLELDRMIYPERPALPEPMVWAIGEDYEVMKARHEAQEEARDAANFQRDRDFAMTLDNVTGVHTGPPRTVK